MGTSSAGDDAEPTWRTWDYLSQNLSLPVHLISFNALANEKNVLLKWTTASEVNNYGFEIERISLDKIGIRSVQSEWVIQGLVKGHGNSNSPKDYSFIDGAVSRGLYKYRLKQINTDGSFEYSEIIEVQFGIEFGTVPSEYFLEQNYPNPFNSTTILKFALPKTAGVKIEVFNALGQKVITLLDKQMPGGFHKLEFNAQYLPSGVYVYKITAGQFQDVKKMLFLR